MTNINELNAVDLFRLGPAARVSMGGRYINFKDSIGKRIVFAAGFPPFDIDDLQSIKRVINTSFPLLDGDELEAEVQSVNKQLKLHALESMGRWGGQRVTR